MVAVMTATIVWFRQDLRLRDNPALDFAARRGGAVIPVYVWAPEDDGDWPPGAASRWWLHRSLQALDASLRDRGSRLVLARGPSVAALERLVESAGATAVCWNRRYEPAAIACSARVTDALHARGVVAESFNASLLAEPWELSNRTGQPYRVFTPFKARLLEAATPPKPLPAPRDLKAPRRWPGSAPLESFELDPKIRWAEGLAETWQPGESGAVTRAEQFVSDSLRSYASRRDRPGEAGTSRLSPHLHFGEIGPRQLWHELAPRERRSAFVSELVWREFAHHLLYHFPQTPLEPLRREFARFPWRRDASLLDAWTRGRTGVPLVDAGMRELWRTGWMHNRVRMVVASFLAKNLLQPWQDGARWFWDTLVDADLANNTLGWQWVAGSGADAAPYFRVFNPVAQAARFDPDGAYVRRWVPELDSELGAAGYPEPIVSLAGSRIAALQAYEEMRAAGKQ